MSHSDHETSREFFAQFFDDYYAESDEHLTLVRRGLLILEEKFRDPAVTRALLDEFFRSFHTLKGISGMVGLSEAEQLHINWKVICDSYGNKTLNSTREVSTC